jgi:serine/threonine protein kinase/peptidoglycan hydrolase-like protein with peptidoglycan-binding domain
MHIQDDDTGEKRAGPATAPDTVVDYVALAPGRVVGRYEVLEVLGQGGFGITYRVRDTQLDREVALKEYLPPALAIRQDGASVLPRSTEVAEDFSWGRERFVAEGRTLAGLHDAPAIVKVFDFIEANGTSYMVMELVRGGTLEDRVKRRGPLQPHEIDTFLPLLLDGLQQVHATGFLHRDIKPGNILLSEAGVPTLIDFGAARLAIAGRSSTMTAIFTPGYAAPEQFTTGKQGPWTDIYGLAATLHHAITGKAPPSAFDRLLEDTYQPLAGLQLIGHAPQLLAGIDAGLAVRFEERPPSIAAWRALLGGPMADANTTVLMPQPVVPPMPAAPPTPPTPPTPPSPPTALAVAPRRSRRPAAIAAGLIVLLGVAGGSYFLARPAQPSPPVETVAVAPAATPAATPETDPAIMAREGEDALQLIPADRQRIQAVLTSLGYDTRGADGSFGQRSREMIAAWQKAKGQPATGYLTAAQVPALFREAPLQAAPGTRASGATAAPQTSSAASRSTGSHDGVYGGGLSTSGMGDHPGVVTAELSISGDRLIGRIIHPGCGASSITLSVAASGEISGSGRVFEGQDCSMAPFTATGRAAGNSVTLEMRTTAGAMRASLTRRGG